MNKIGNVLAQGRDGFNFSKCATKNVGAIGLFADALVSDRDLTH